MTRGKLNTEQTFLFGPFRLDARERVLLRDGEPLALAPKLIDTLVALVERSGHVVEKSELIERVWPETFVEESNLTSNVSLLRKALGETERGRPYIETVPRRGYRFSAPVALATPEDEEGVEVVVRRRTRARLSTVEEFDDDGSQETTRRALHASGAQRGTLAVLPFESLGAPSGVGTDEFDEFLGLGLADALITQLGNTGRIVVRPTSAVRGYAGAGRDSLSIGRELGVEAVVEGSVQRAGGRLRVTVRMLGVSDGVPLWADRFSAEFTDIFDVQDSIAEQVARALTPKLAAENRERLRKRHTENVEAYQAYLRGRYFWNKRNVEGFKKAIAHFRAAIELDAAYALAYSGLADAYAMLASWGEQRPGEALPRALAAAETALEMDEELSEAHTSLGSVLYFLWEHERAEVSLQRAIELNPNNANAHSRYAQLLVSRERFDEALREVRLAQELDPLSPMANTALAGPLFYSRQFERAAEQYRKVLEMEPDFIPALFCLGASLAHGGEFDEAVAATRRAAELSGEHPLIVAALAGVLAQAGRREEALAKLEQLTSDGRAAALPYSLATVYARLGDRERALACIERAFEERNTHLNDLNIDPEFDTVRDDPRFRDLVARVGLRVKPPAPARP
ncbi:MAG TPA: winged helix-turn-helix domain-containing protein [Pyrinomonadaceae bacterium]|nr:winged helix-turn-helix domain-containing protein [Pyrinomonadaceae bacterium]